MGCEKSLRNAKMQISGTRTAAMEEEDAPKKHPNMVIGENLDAISVAELEHRIEALDSEIARLRAEITRKQASRTAADAFFRK
jgi:uncharacterized small protein (DUF1192 family)